MTNLVAEMHARKVNNPLVEKAQKKSVSLERISDLRNSRATL